MEKFGEEINFEVLDSGYKTPAICKMIIDDNKIPLMPYSRPKGPKALMSKKEFIYNKETDTFICPNNETLAYSTTNKEGYISYKSNHEKCLKCSFRDKCTKRKNHQQQLTVHVWNYYLEAVNNLRYTLIWKEKYPKRKQTIERVFADCKENMCLRFTRVKGQKKNQINATMIFACHNLKKMALWRSKMTKKEGINPSFNEIIDKILLIITKKRQISKNYTYLSTV